MKFVLINIFSLFAGDAELRPQQEVICQKRPRASILPGRQHASSSPATLSINNNDNNDIRPLLLLLLFSLPMVSKQ